MNAIDPISWIRIGSPVQRLWGFIFLLALKDKATRVYYDPSREERSLTYEIEGVEYAMVPPSVELAPSITIAINDVIGSLGASPTIPSESIGALLLTWA